MKEKITFLLDAEEKAFLWRHVEEYLEEKQRLISELEAEVKRLRETGAIDATTIRKCFDAIINLQNQVNILEATIRQKKEDETEWQKEVVQLKSEIRSLKSNTPD